MRAVIERELRRVGVRPRDLNIVAELGLTESTKAAVEAGLGVSFMSRLSMEREVADGPLGGRHGRRPEHAAHPVLRPSRHRPLSRPTQTFLEFARGELGERGALESDTPSGPVRGGRVG